MEHYFEVNEENKLKTHLIESIDLSKCRLCQQQQGITEIQLKPDLSHQIHACTQIHILEDDRSQTLPRFICNVCADRVVEFYHFQQMCLRIDEQLKELLEESKNIPEIIIGIVDKTEGDESNLNSPLNDLKFESDFNSDPFADDNKSVEEEGFTCTFENCTKSYPTKGALMRHRYKTHNLRDFLCKTCGKRFGKSGNLKDHEKIHSKAFKCTKCDRRFSQLFMLKGHVKLHHEGHRFYCPQCGKSFLTPHSLKRHELIHIGVKRFKCETCSLAFYTNVELSKHQLYHQNIRPHVCSICHKAFVLKNHLAVHMRRHTGEKPYRCDVTGCQKTFAHRGDLRKHSKNVHHLILPPQVRSVPRPTPLLCTT